MTFYKVGPIQKEYRFKKITLEDIMDKICENNRQQTAKLLKIEKTLDGITEVQWQIIANQNATETVNKIVNENIKNDISVAGVQIGKLRREMNVLKYEVNLLISDSFMVFFIQFIIDDILLMIEIILAYSSFARR
jgi:hypothetical protein